MNVGDGVFIIYRRRRCSSMTGLLEYGLLVMGIAIGGGVGWLMAKQTMSGRIIRAEERLKANEEAAESNEQRIRAEVENIAMKVGEENSARFLELAEASGRSAKRRPTRPGNSKIGGGQSHQTASGRDGENDEHQHRNGGKERVRTRASSVI